MPLLAVDVGAGTQDILLYRESVSLEGSTKMVLPSPTVLVAGKIDRARSQGADVFLEGPTMGGGPSSAAVMRHLKAGLKVYATPSAAATINDNLGRVAQMGVTIQEEMPSETVRISTRDIDIPPSRRLSGSSTSTSLTMSLWPFRTMGFPRTSQTDWSGLSIWPKLSGPEAG